MNNNDWERLETLGNIPIDAALLHNLFSDYASPSNKIEELCRKGLLLRARRGLYIVATKISHKLIEPGLVANHLYGPSYVSFETAMEFHGMIPERVFTVKSATPGRTKLYNTELGRYEFLRVPMEYFRAGIRMAGPESCSYMIASPEKALCDFLMLSANLRIQSLQSMRDFLENFMRIDMDIVVGFDPEIIMACIETGRKKTTLTQLLGVVQNG